MSKSLSHFNEVPDSFELFPLLQLAASSRIRSLPLLLSWVRATESQQRGTATEREREKKRKDKCQCTLHRPLMRSSSLRKLVLFDSSHSSPIADYISASVYYYQKHVRRMEEFILSPYSVLNSSLQWNINQKRRENEEKTLCVAWEELSLLICLDLLIYCRIKFVFISPIKKIVYNISSAFSHVTH